MNGARATCLLADDHPALLVAVREFLDEHGFEIVAAVGDGDAAVAAAVAHAPAAAVVDYRMPRCGGRQLLRRLREASPETRLAVYTAEADQQLVAEALEAGADAIVLKEAPLLDLVRALVSVVEGRRYVDPALAMHVLEPQSQTVSLTPRELDVLTLLAEGLSHEQIGERLQIGSETVRTHARKAADRLGARTRTQAVARAIRLRLL
ncbi:MAG TPA: response regulator transcription factor [Gaiellaceae bacterium]|nr:response regulator transcription factor [Gaiellaceae bacterium]